nr:neocarzinostatin apoprotein domain-containing protein [Streptomyces sp. SID5468]
MLTVLAALALPFPAAAADGPAVRLGAQQGGAGGTVTVTGTGWRPHTLLTLLICGQDAIGGTDACANAAGRTATTDTTGAFRQSLPVAEPPKPCPCVVHVATVLGQPAAVDAPFTVAGHPVAPLPPNDGGGRLTALAVRLDGDGSLLTWFGAPAQRQLVLTVGNTAADPARDPVFRIGVAHGVYSPQWQDQRWHGTVAPGAKALVRLPVELAAGAHGDYRISVAYAGRVLAVQPWSVARPWGVTLFWVLLCVVVPAAVFRIGMAVVDRIRPRRPRGPRRPPSGPPPGPRAATLPWFAPHSMPGARPAPATPSAPSTDDRPSAKGTP